MKKTFLICSLSGRLQSLARLITSLSEFSDWHLDLVLQKYRPEEKAIIDCHSKRFFGDKCRIFTSEEMTGPHMARCIALDADQSDVWCILDDDMFAVAGKTHYNEMAEILISKQSIGFLSSNWRKTEKMLEKVAIRDSLVKQNIVYTGGGMMFRQDVADIIKAIPRVQYLFDNPLWSIYSYVNGYDNFRYLGSAAVHEICTNGGRRKWINESNSHKALPPSDWLNVRRGKGKEGSFDEYLICDSGDITSFAHELHRRNQK